MDSDGEDDTPPLLRAAYEGDLPALRRAIADGADVNVEGEIDEDGDGPYTALHWLVNNTPQGDDDLRIACITALLEAGADVNRPGGHMDLDLDEDPYTPLMDAVFLCGPNPDSCHAERTIIEMLIRAGADLNIASEGGFTPLHMAAVWGSWHIIPVLLAAGAEVDALWPNRNRDERGEPLGTTTLETPLDSALRSDQRHAPDRCRHRVFVALLRAGARLPTNRDNLPPYVDAVVKAGGYARYERAHCERLAAIFTPKPEADKGRRRSKRRRSPLHGLPAEVMQNIVSILWDCGGH